MNNKLLNLNELAEILGVSRSTIYRWSERPDFPKKQKIGPNSVRWLESEVENWVQEFYL